ncbi:recombinase family protein [Mariprofundus ferrooxydans]|nr:recombinase family protein [Mariprofundus ferrooxydans]
MSKKAYSYIRFSTPEQLKGDSLRRQLESSRKYALEHNLVLDESLRDLGVSAFKGKNATEGALKQFMELIDAGQVEQGSILILESLDRLSRQQVFTALSLFSSILAAGVEIVTLADGQHYTADSINDVGQLVFSLISLSRAHDESAMKSKRAEASWDMRRQRAIEKKTPATGRSPDWLRLADDKQGFESIPERVAIIRKVFAMVIAGTGQRKIAAMFNEQGITPFGTSAMWYPSYIAKVINNRAVLGEYQPKQNKIPLGDPVTHYYPAIIPEDDFYKAYAIKTSKAPHTVSGRKGKSFSNLFTGMCKCLQCGTTYRMQSGYMKCDLQVLQGKLMESEKQISRFTELFSMVDDASMLGDARIRYMRAMKEVGQIQ